MAKPTRFGQDLFDEYVARGLWNTENWVDVLKRNVKLYPDKEAFVDSKTRITWTQLDVLSDRLALGFAKLGIKRDEAIVVQIASSVENVVLRMAFQKAGILSSFPPLTFRHREIEYVLGKLKAVGVVTHNRLRGVDFLGMVKEIAPNLPALKHIFSVDDDLPPDTISIRAMMERPLEQAYPKEYLKDRYYRADEVTLLTLTSGSTGLPKLVENINAGIKTMGRTVNGKIKATPDDVYAILAPISGGAGIATLSGALQLGAKSCFQEHFSPEGALSLLEKERVTFLSAVPTQVIRMIRECDTDKYDLSALRVARTGTAGFDPRSAAEAEEKLNCTITIAMGSSETANIAQSSVDDPREVRFNTLGTAVFGSEFKIVDDAGVEVPQGEVGELWARGGSSSSGYYQDVEATVAAWGELGKNGWYRTGDLAKVDEGGNISIVGRKKDMILRGGQNVFPREIELELLSHPKVQDACVVGVPDPVMGERVCAFVVPARGEEPSVQEMVSFLRGKRLAVHKLPERLEFIEQLPLLGDQKVDKIALRKRIIETLAAEGRHSAAKEGSKFVQQMRHGCEEVQA